MRIPFDIKYRPQIESGEYKVETRDGRPARIALWDFKNIDYPILAAIQSLNNEDAEYDYTYTVDGYYDFSKEEHIFDLCIVIPDEDKNPYLEREVISRIVDSLKKHSGLITFEEKAKEIYNALRPLIEVE